LVSIGLIELLELNDSRNQFELGRKDIADAIGETYHQSKRREFVIELARSNIMAVFNENTPNKSYL